MKKWIDEMLLNTRNWKEVPCSYLAGGRCSIYEDRPSCCRNFPDFENTALCGLLHYCPLKKTGAAMTAEEKRKICFLCGAECCKKIFIPKNVEFKESQFTEWLDLSCRECGEIEWCRIVQPELFK